MTQTNEVWAQGSQPGDPPISSVVAAVSPDALQRQEFNDLHEAALNLLASWGTLTLAQKDTVLRNLLRWALYTEGRLPYGS